VNVGVIGVGHALPAQKVGNARFADIGLTDEWIYRRTGIRNRHWLSTGESLHQLAALAASEALRSAAMSADEIDVLIVATSALKPAIPPIAPIVAEAIGIVGAGAFDLNAACSGFLYGVSTAVAMIESGRARHVIVCGADSLSQVTDTSDRSTACLFGDGAGAVVLGAGRSFTPPHFNLGSDGSQRHLICINSEGRYLQMEGLDVYEFAVARMTRELKMLLDHEKGCGDTIDWIIPHQANGKMLAAVRKNLSDEYRDLVYSNIADVGNTSAASIPIGLAQVLRQEDTKRSGRVAAVAFGAGLTWGSLAISYRVDGNR
jgi:3-oxoacyl-[acyl-carrier-protein] synthase-3